MPGQRDATDVQRAFARSHWSVRQLFASLPSQKIRPLAILSFGVDSQFSDVSLCNVFGSHCAAAYSWDSARVPRGHLDTMPGYTWVYRRRETKLKLRLKRAEMLTEKNTRTPTQRRSCSSYPFLRFPKARMRAAAAHPSCVTSDVLHAAAAR
jgi:hypothetical protein